MPPRRPGHVTIAGRPLAYALSGTGAPAVVLIHGWACSQRFWRYQAAALAAHTTVLTLDLCGHGGSAPPAAAEAPSMAGFGRDVAALADTLGLADVVLVGHSMGGPVAVEAAARLPGRCRLVVGVDTFTDGAFYQRRPPDEIARRVKPFATDFEGTMAKMVGRITRAGGPALVRWITTRMCRLPRADALACLRALLDWDIAARWPALPCPVETINAAILSDGLATVLTLDGLLVHRMADVGHFPMLEAPAALTERLCAVLRRTLEDPIRREASPPSGSS